MCSAAPTAAFAGAWEAGLADVAKSLPYVSLAAWKQAWPSWASAIEAASADLAPILGVDALNTDVWAARLAEPKAKQQQYYTQRKASAAATELRTRLPQAAADALHAASGPGAGAFLECPVDSTPLPDAHFRIALRRRLRCERLVAGAAADCRNRDSAGHHCGCDQGDDGGRHALVCPKGGGRMTRHNHLRDTLCHWLTTLGAVVTKEQYVLDWSTPQQQAYLDLAVVLPNGTQLYVDVTVQEGGAARQRGARTVHLLSRAVGRKHRRYPGPGLVAFAVDTLGRVDPEADGFLRAAARAVTEDGVELGRLVRRGRALVATAVQRACATQIMGAALGARPGGA